MKYQVLFSLKIMNDTSIEKLIFFCSGDWCFNVHYFCCFSLNFTKFATQKLTTMSMDPVYVVITQCLEPCHRDNTECCLAIEQAEIYEPLHVISNNVAF